MSTFFFLVVVVYIFSFIALQYFNKEYTNEAGFNIYCDTLSNCLYSTLAYGMRAGGGIGDDLEQPVITDAHYRPRYWFDFLFFIIVNIVLLNILFGIIIDSFADKRAQDAEINAEK